VTAAPVVDRRTDPVRPPSAPADQRRRPRTRPNIPAGVVATFWLAVVALPIYYIVLTSVRSSDSYVSDGPLQWPTHPTLHNYRNVLDLGFSRFLLNSVTVTAAVIVIVLGFALPAAYAIARGRTRPIRAGFTVFLIGLAIPAQAVIIPIYFIITRLYLYDSLLAVILPTAAFSLPMSVVVLTSALRDIPVELYEAMSVDGATPRRVFLSMVLPMTRPGLVTVGIFSGLGAWNGFLFPLVLTQSDSERVLPLGLWNFENQYGTDVPGLLAAVVLSALPVLALYLFGRRFLLRGLAAGFGK
jgi:raffinose/stachyose/melibiose transport system permease protein/xylobiose transport system permease protein